jgi:hypothetical protein
MQNTQVGRKLENPFTVENMSKALDNLTKSARISKAVTIETSHIYIKFKPKNKVELDILKRDSTIDYYEYPLDYELISIGDHYHDPSLPDNIPTYQYASIPINQIIPQGIDYEVIANCYIPDDLPENTQPNGRKMSEDMADALIEEAFKITGNTLENESNENTRVTALSNKRPKGTISVMFNGVLTPIEGLEVRAKRWLTTHKGFTNVNGYFECDGTYKRDWNYEIRWERHNYRLNDGNKNGVGLPVAQNTTSDLNIGIQNWPEQEFYAHNFMGCYQYYYGDIKGLRRPPENSVSHPQMTIACNMVVKSEGNIFTNGEHRDSYRFKGGKFDWIEVYNPNNLVTWRTDTDEYATLIHELAHASHWQLDKNRWDNIDAKLVESWARGVEVEITRIKFQYYKAQYQGNYTSLIVDLIDNNPYNTNTLDNVTGYTIKNLENALVGQQDWTGYMYSIKDKFNNPTENEIEKLFSSL